MTTTTITNPIVGTASLGSSSTLAISTAFVINYVNNLTMILRQNISYSLSGIKTFLNDFTVTDTSSGASPNIGTVRAGTINLCPSSSGALRLNTFDQLLQPITSTSWSKPLVIALPQDTATPHTVIITGITTALTTGVNTTVTFSTAFTAGCVPRVWCCSTSTVPALIAVFDVTNTNFKARQNSGGTISGSYFALGF
jgi:hypothetical protein